MIIAVYLVKSLDSDANQVSASVTNVGYTSSNFWLSNQVIEQSIELNP